MAGGVREGCHHPPLLRFMKCSRLISSCHLLIKHRTELLLLLSHRVELGRARLDRSRASSRDGRGREGSRMEEMGGDGGAHNASLHHYDVRMWEENGRGDM